MAGRNQNGEFVVSGNLKNRTVLIIILGKSDFKKHMS